MNLLSIILALVPVLVILILLVWRRTPADIAGVIGWLFALLIAWLYFKTPLVNTLLISLTGVVASLPITIMFATSLLQITIMKEAGAIDRVVAFIKTIAPGNQVAQILILNLGIGTLLAAMGATPVSILPPIMLALGYSTFVAIALPSLGYDALCTYALLGVPVIVFSNFVGLPVNEVGGFICSFHANHQHLYRPAHVVAGWELEITLAGSFSNYHRWTDCRTDRHCHECPGFGDFNRDCCRTRCGVCDAGLS